MGPSQSFTGNNKRGWWSAIRSDLGKYVPGSKSLCLDANATDARYPGNGTPVTLWECNGNDNQLWTPDGWKLRSAVGTNMCLDVDAPKGPSDGWVDAATRGHSLQLWACDGGWGTNAPNQQWSTPAGNPPPAIGVSGLASLGCSGSSCYTTGNYFPYGQCTWGAQAEFWQYLWSSTGTGRYINVWGNAKDWAVQARSAGWFTDTRARPHSLVVFQASRDVDDPSYVNWADWNWGHVAWVDTVNSDGTINITEMNNINNPSGGANPTSESTPASSPTGRPAKPDQPWPSSPCPSTPPSVEAYGAAPCLRSTVSAADSSTTSRPGEPAVVILVAAPRFGHRATRNPCQRDRRHRGVRPGGRAPGRAGRSGPTPAP